MLRLDKVIKPWKESLALNDHINLYGFWNETAFLTKTGDLGMVLSVPGVDYESLDHSEQDYAVKRLEAALTAFGPGFHVYQYLFKSNPDIPFAKYDDPIAQIEVLDQQGQFTFFRRLLNYDDRLIAGKLQSTQFLDYQVVNSDIESEHDQLRVGDYIGRVLTMKEAITETRPLVLDALLKIPANFPVVTEWTPLSPDKARKEVNKRRRHFNMSKTGFVSQMGNDATKTNPPDVLVDESKQADIENLGDCLRALGDGQSLGDFSLTIVLFGRGSSGHSRTELDQLVAEFIGVFNADGNLFAETYNQLNAYFATLRGNNAINVRKLYLLNTNYADLSFLFTILPGEKTNAHLGTEYLAAIETDNSTAYFLNLHNGEVAHTLILGMTGSGKT
jgi:type IV secretory pathway VirB4 component